MPVELGYFTVPVKDLDRGRAFYGRLFGWEFEDGDKSAHVKNTKLPLGLSPTGPASLKSLYFRVDDVRAAIATVRELGGHAEEPATYPSGLNSLCQDDQGTEFNLWQPAEGY